MEPGAGVEARARGAVVRIGTSAWLAAAGISTAALDPTAEQLAMTGRTPSFVAVHGILAGVIAIADRPAAEGALYPLRGWLLSPVVASAAMSRSSVSVLANSLRLRRFGRKLEATHV
jgi:Cu+-exporting ATPase